MDGDRGAESSTHIAKCVVRGCLHVLDCLFMHACLHVSVLTACVPTTVALPPALYILLSQSL